MAGVAMMGGLLIGSFIGLKMLVWEITYWSPAPTASKNVSGSKNKTNQPIIGISIIILGILLALVYDNLDYSIRGGFLFFGLVLGIIMQRTRFCFVRAFVFCVIWKVFMFYCLICQDLYRFRYRVYRPKSRIQTWA